MATYILGISCFFHDSAACLIKDGEIVAAAQEERFTRIKHDARFPKLAINACLEQEGIDESDLACVAFYENNDLVLDRIGFEIWRQPFRVAVQQFVKLMRSWRSGKVAPHGVIRDELPNFCGEVKCVEHHHAHAASAFYPSPYDEAAVLTIDGVGEWSTTTLCKGDKNEIEVRSKIDYPNSLGLFYSAATNYLGFKVNSGEYKVMGLAPYGQPIYCDLIKENIINICDNGSVILNPQFFDFSSIADMATIAWGKLFGCGHRTAESELTQFHMDIASSIQLVTTEAMLKMAQFAKDITGAKYLCMSGGVALNCVGNGEILRAGIFEDIWVQPASGDAGNALGAALAVWHNDYETQYTPKNGQDQMHEARLGTAYATSEITDFLELYNYPYVYLEQQDIAQVVVDLIVDGKIIGLFSGRMEFGPRALGGRSIIGDPRSPEMQKRMNLKVKFRESFRPFAPIVREEDASDWFDIAVKSPYMLLVAPVSESKRSNLIAQDEANLRINERLAVKRSEISAVTHVDYSARVQTVAAEPMTTVRALLDEFAQRTNVPVLINTSFNLRSEPIVQSPMDAYRCMMRSNIDAVLLENILILRSDQPQWVEEGDWRDDFEAD